MSLLRLCGRIGRCLRGRADFGCQIELAACPVAQVSRSSSSSSSSSSNSRSNRAAKARQTGDALVEVEDVLTGLLEVRLRVDRFRNEHLPRSPRYC